MTGAKPLQVQTAKFRTLNLSVAAGERMEAFIKSELALQRVKCQRPLSISQALSDDFLRKLSLDGD